MAPTTVEIGVPRNPWDKDAHTAPDPPAYRDLQGVLHVGRWPTTAEEKAEYCAAVGECWQIVSAVARRERRFSEAVAAIRRVLLATGLPPEPFLAVPVEMLPDMIRGTFNLEAL